MNKYIGRSNYGNLFLAEKNSDDYIFIKYLYNPYIPINISILRNGDLIQKRLILTKLNKLLEKLLLNE